MTTNKISRKRAISRESGFSLIELSTALLFVAFIMVFLITTLVSIMRTYNKGVWLSQINQAGRQINTDIGAQARFSGSATFLADKQRLCVGGVSYIWNTKDSKKNRFYEETSGTEAQRLANSNLRLVRVIDPSAQYCGAANPMPKKSGDNNVTNMLGSGAIIQEFSVSSSTATNLLRVQAAFSTDGDNQPRKIDGRWQCGDVQPDGSFKVGNNQYCAAMEFNLVVFRRGE